jgi:hypothetical protein
MKRRQFIRLIGGVRLRGPKLAYSFPAPQENGGGIDLHHAEGKEIAQNDQFPTEPCVSSGNVG